MWSFCRLLSSLPHAQSLCFLPSSSLLRYGGNLSLQSAMSVRFNSNGTQLLALRRRLPPVLYDIHSRLPVFQFDNQGYFNSCTMKSCCFAGDRDQGLRNEVWRIHHCLVSNTWHTVRAQ
ncbi:DDB1- and CUL4-associated factor 5-like [Leptonychotes weddellii]|uniref:DDB1- and CUL4-associated factor 5-like n=1 Tax=Leptonychotes weddellii TaxID=9713 RepID=A0A7F8QD60_LEPWE|nr:DDB1- and CUL4-associated factor 5-like [Leptonychotes weddellii]